LASPVDICEKHDHISKITADEHSIRKWSGPKTA